MKVIYLRIFTWMLKLQCLRRISLLVQQATFRYKVFLIFTKTIKSISNSTFSLTYTYAFWRICVLKKILAVEFKVIKILEKYETQMAKKNLFPLYCVYIVFMLPPLDMFYTCIYWFKYSYMLSHMCFSISKFIGKSEVCS